MNPTPEIKMYPEDDGSHKLKITRKPKETSAVLTTVTREFLQKYDDVRDEINALFAGKRQPDSAKTVQHTPPPWDHLEPIGEGLHGVMSKHVNEGGNFYVAQCNRGADAAFIVRVANHYELMVGLLKEVYTEKGGASANIKGKIEEAFKSAGEVL